MTKAINTDNASEMQKKSVQSRALNVAKRNKMIPEWYEKGGIEEVMKSANVGRVQAQRLINQFVTQ